MKKLKLEMEELCVESFHTEQASGRDGTVIGHYPTPHCSVDDGYTCAYSCGGQFASCVATCGTCGGTECGCLPPARWTDYYVDTICGVG